MSSLSTKFSRRDIFLVVLFITCFDLSLHLTSHLYHQHQTPAPTASPPCSCGTSISQAQSLGCTYDELAIAWLPPSCRDDDLTREFSRAGSQPDGSWPYFLDEDAKVPLTVADVALLADSGTPFYTTHEWYLVHCNYSWRKLFRAATGQTRVVMDLRNHSLNHTINCGALDTKYHALPLRSVSTRSENSFGYV